MFTINSVFADVAILGDYLSDSENLGNVCRIEIEKGDDRGFSMYTCSGTVISKTKIITAAHCLFDYKNKTYYRVNKIICNFGEVRINREFHHDFKLEINTAYKTDSSDKNDIGIIDISPFFQFYTVKPMLMADDFHIRYWKEHFQNIDCRISGFGMDNDKNQGKQRTARFFRDVKIKNNTIKTYISLKKENLTYHGDSGGALYCLLPSSEENFEKKWILVGVISSGNKLLKKMSFSKVRKDIIGLNFVDETLNNYSCETSFKKIKNSLDFIDKDSFILELENYLDKECLGYKNEVGENIIFLISATNFFSLFDIVYNYINIHKYDPNIFFKHKNIYNENALFYAKNKDIFKKLLIYHLEINTENNRVDFFAIGCKPFFRFIMLNDVEFIRFLKDNFVLTFDPDSNECDREIRKDIIENNYTDMMDILVIKI